MDREGIEKRFVELVKMGQSPEMRLSSHSGESVHGGWYHRWATSSQNLIGSVFGRESDHYRGITEKISKFSGWKSDYENTMALLYSAYDDWQRGFYQSLEIQISGEIFGDFVRLAREALSQGHKDTAAVLACAALEDALKRYAHLNGLDMSGKTMDNVIGALKGAGLVSGAQKSLLDVMPKVRNAAMHADFSKISESDVGSVLGFTEQFLLTKFS